jgi:toxin ParE1/3/4
VPYRLSSLAEQDLDEIWLFVAEAASPSTADRLIDDLINRFSPLTEQPRIGRLRPEFGDGVRSFPVENHVILLPARARGIDCQSAPRTT